MSKCNSCGQEMVWIKSSSGKSIPCDPEKYHIQDDLVSPDLMVVSDTGQVGKLSKVESGRVSHFATCPDAKKFRRK